MEAIRPLEFFKEFNALKCSERPSYPYYFEINRAGFEAKALGIESIHSLEFGVAGGRGLFKPLDA